jgi:uncharacterized membrane-anchored protein YjiN (DUF445 family)
MKAFKILLVGSLLAAAPVGFAKHNDQKDEEICQNDEDPDCGDNQALEKAIKDLEKAVSKFQDEIICTEWDSELTMSYLDDLYDTTKKLKAKADKNDDAKKLKKYFKDIEEIFGLVDDEVGGSIKDSKRECKDDKSMQCKIVEGVFKSFSKLEHALEHVGHEI